MTFRPILLALALSLVSAGAATGAVAVDPKPGVELTGVVKFPREQRMSIQTDAKDSSKLKVRLGFDGLCKGAGLQEAWVSTIPAKPTVRVRDGRFAADMTGTATNLGGVRGRTGEFSWTLTGRFVEDDVVSATVSGTAEIKKNGRVISRCRIAEPTPARLTVR